MKEKESKSILELEGIISTEVYHIAESFISYAKEYFLEEELEDGEEYEKEICSEFFDNRFEEFIERACHDSVISEEDMIFMLSDEGQEFAVVIVEEAAIEFIYELHIDRGDNMNQ
jgi:hypothetical protein